MRHRLYVWLQAFMVCGALVLTGCENGNLFGKLTKRGDSSDPQILISQANDELRNGNYSEALNLFNKALSADPDNAEALYGAATAALAGSGFNIGALVTNLSNQSSSLAVNDLSGLIKQSRISVSAAYSAPNSILDGVDLEALNGVINQVICRLQKIVSGATDGSIQPNDPDVLLNLASICVIRAILRPVRANFMDITNTNGTWGVSGLPQFDNTFCDNNQELIAQLAQDVVATYHLFVRASTVLNVGNDQLIAQIREDVRTVATKLLDPVGSENLPDNCITNLAALTTPITSATFENAGTTDVFTANSNSCN